MRQRLALWVANLDMGEIEVCLSCFIVLVVSHRFFISCFCSVYVVAKVCRVRTPTEYVFAVFRVGQALRSYVATHIILIRW